MPLNNEHQLMASSIPTDTFLMLAPSLSAAEVHPRILHRPVGRLSDVLAIRVDACGLNIQIRELQKPAY